MAIQLIPALLSAAPTLFGALKSGKGTYFDKAIDLLSAFLGSDKSLTPAEIDLRLRTLDQDKYMELKKLEHEMQLTVKNNEHEMQKLQMQVGKIAAETTKVDAASNDKFQSRWRPALAWVCVLGFAWAAAILPIIMSVFAFSIILGASPDTILKVKDALPALDVATLVTMLGYVLGYGYYRTREKKEGEAK